eukprot:5937532-Ditylum_brightwellii.AAC.1
MHCAGSTFTVLSMTNYNCDVDPFLGTYQTTTDVPVIRAATAVQISAHEIIYLISSTCLWFGD